LTLFYQNEIILIFVKSSPVQKRIFGLAQKKSFFGEDFGEK
jgi:hypothetical protein